MSKIASRLWFDGKAAAESTGCRRYSLILS